MRAVRERRHVVLLVVGAVLAGVGLAPAAAQATPIEEGHPEIYENGVPIDGSENPVALAGWGMFHVESPVLGSEGIECVAVGFGDAWNEGAALRGRGQILAWDAAGHAPITGHPKLSPSCRPEGARIFFTDEGAVEFERNPTTHEVEAQHRGLSTPWNVETSCGVREEGLSYVSIVRIGVPNSAFPSNTSTPCPELSEESEIAEKESYVKERTEHKGCYVSKPSPEGCIHATLVEPGSGLELALGGTLWARGINGVKDGLMPSVMSLEEEGGLAECESVGCTQGWTFTGQITVVGFNKIELIQAR